MHSSTNDSRVTYSDMDVSRTMCSNMSIEEEESCRRRIRVSIRKILACKSYQKFGSIAEIVSTALFGSEQTPGVGVMCSTVVAATLYDAGIIGLQKNINKYVPSDFVANDGWVLKKTPPRVAYVMGYRSNNFAI